MSVWSVEARKEAKASLPVLKVAVRRATFAIDPMTRNCLGPRLLAQVACSGCLPGQSHHNPSWLSQKIGLKDRRMCRGADHIVRLLHFNVLSVQWYDNVRTMSIELAAAMTPAARPSELPLAEAHADSRARLVFPRCSHLVM